MLLSFFAYFCFGGIQNFCIKKGNNLHFGLNFTLIFGPADKLFYKNSLVFSEYKPR